MIMKKNVFISTIAMLFFFTACKKELSDNFTIYTGDPRNDTVWVVTTPGNAPIHQLANQFLPDLIIDTFDCALGDTITFKDYISIRIPAASFTENSGTATASGKVRLEFFRLKKKGDFIKFFKPTTSSGYLVESGGGFFIRVVKNGQELKLAPTASITVRFADTEEPKNNMQVFHARETLPFISSGIDTMHTWTRHTDTSWIKTWQGQDSLGNVLKGYELTTTQLRWTAANRYIDSSLPHTNIFAYLPQNFTNKNTVVYAVFENQKIVVNLTAEYRSRSFTTMRIPRGAKIRILSFSRLGTDLYLGTKLVNDVGTNNVYKIEPQKKSLTDILAYINGL
jgi:hypothetical protein